MSYSPGGGIFVLPNELRDAIYDELIPYKQIHIKTCLHYDPEYGFKGRLVPILALAHTNRQLRREVLSYARRCQEWVFYGRDAVDNCKKLPQAIVDSVSVAGFWCLAMWVGEDGTLEALQGQVQGLCTLAETCTQLKQINVKISPHEPRNARQTVGYLFQSISSYTPSIVLNFFWQTLSKGEDIDMQLFGAGVSLDRDVVVDTIRILAAQQDIHVVFESEGHIPLTLDIY